LARRQAKASLERYIDYLELGIRPAAHHRLLLGHLAAVERGDIARLLVAMPPGSAKSTYASGIFPAWYMGRDPRRSVIATSHTDELAESFGRRVRNLFGSPDHRNVFGVGVSPDNQAAGRWETELGGQYYAAGVGGSITGRRADLGIIDDPVKNRQDADSELSRQRKWDWYVNDFRPRLKPEAAQIVIATRWHEDDLTGRLLTKEPGRWHLLELPMEAMPNDPLGRKVGQRLWPEWFTEEMVEDAKRDTRAWNALYQQQPAAEEGDYFKLDWFGEYDQLPQDVHFYGASDFAVTEGAGDYTEHGIFAVDLWSNVYIHDWWRDQTAADRWIERQCDMVRTYKPQCWFGESGPIRRSVEPYMLRRMNERNVHCRIEWLPSVSDKPTRCRPFQALASMGKVFIQKNMPHRADLIGQLTRFPAGRYDDGVDVCSLLGRGLEVVKAPRLKPRVEAARPVIRAGDQPGTAWLGT
jgi:predicted phage terminase large subunit-like protein